MARKQPVSAIHKFEVTYRWNGGTRTYETEASGPIMALNGFHRSMQRERELDGGRKVVRPKLGPSEYELLGLNLIWWDMDKKTKRTPYDLPKTPNPCVTMGKVPKTETETFGFFAETPVRKLDAHND